MAELEERAIRGRIKQARKEAGITQQAFAELLEVIPRTAQNYEQVDPDKGGRTPWGRMNAIAKITGKTQEWLLHGDTPDVMGSLNSDGPLHEIKTQLDRIEETQERMEELLLELTGADDEQEPGESDQATG